MKTLLGLLLLTIAIAGCGGGQGSKAAGPTESPLQGAYTACTKYIGPVQKAINRAPFGVYDRPIAEDFLTYKQGSVLVQTPKPEGDEMSALAFRAARCILEETKAPPSILQAMGSSTALTGRQRDDYAGIKVGWSFNGTTPSSFEASFEPATS